MELCSCLNHIQLGNKIARSNSTMSFQIIDLIVRLTAYVTEC